MTELSGSLEGIGLPALIRFLAGLQKSGTLRIWQGGWAGEIGFDGGRVVTASFGPERGLAALESLMLLGVHGRFAFQEGVPPTDHTIAMPAGELDAYLTSLEAHAAQLSRLIPSLAAIPEVAPPVDPPGSGEQVTLDRGTIGLLLAIDGWRTVSELARDRGLAPTVRALARLVSLGLVRMRPALEPALPVPPAPPSVKGATEGTTDGATDGVTAPQAPAPPLPEAAVQAAVPATGRAPESSTAVPDIQTPAGEAARPAVPPLSLLRYWRRALALAMAILVLMVLNWQLTSRADRVVRTQPVVPTMVPTVPEARRSPAVTPPAATPSLPAGPQLRTILDEHFIDPGSGWPNDPEGPAWYAGGAYRLAVRQAEHVVIVNAPLDKPVRDVVVTVVAQKAGGPNWGGYGVVVRDQMVGPRPRYDQNGRFLLFQVSDRGEVGIWRRVDTQWVELMPWTPAGSVRTGDMSNELTVQALGTQLTFLVNGVVVATVTDTDPVEGAVGIFAGGALNEVRVERFRVQVPD